MAFDLSSFLGGEKASTSESTLSTITPQQLEQLNALFAGLGEQAAGLQQPLNRQDITEVFQRNVVDPGRETFAESERVAQSQSPFFSTDVARAGAQRFEDFNESLLRSRSQFAFESEQSFRELEAQRQGLSIQAQQTMAALLQIPQIENIVTANPGVMGALMAILSGGAAAGGAALGASLGKPTP